VDHQAEYDQVKERLTFVNAELQKKPEEMADAIESLEADNTIDEKAELVAAALERMRDMHADEDVLSKFDVVPEVKPVVKTAIAEQKVLNAAPKAKQPTLEDWLNNRGLDAKDILKRQAKKNVRRKRTVVKAPELQMALF